MGRLADDLRETGYERTEKQSPFHDSGELWTNSYELVCDETAIVIRKDEPQRSIDPNPLPPIEQQAFDYDDRSTS